MLRLCFSCGEHKWTISDHVLRELLHYLVEQLCPNASSQHDSERGVSWALSAFLRFCVAACAPLERLLQILGQRWCRSDQPVGSAPCCACARPAVRRCRGGGLFPRLAPSTLPAPFPAWLPQRILFLCEVLGVEPRATFNLFHRSSYNYLYDNFLQIRSVRLCTVDAIKCTSVPVLISGAGRKDKMNLY